VLENIVHATDIDLLKLAVPHWSNQDAGRYLGTWHINVTKDPETGSRNVGVYRMQLLGPKQATVSASPRSHLARHFAKAEKLGQPLPMAVAIGVSESVLMAAAAAYPDAMDEYELAGALQQKAVPLIRCQAVDLEVPADSEIVIEGLIQPGVRVQDGPYFDYTGTPNTNPSAFRFEATRLAFRSNPIFRGTSIGVAGAEDHQLFAFLAELQLVDFHGSRLKQMVQNVLLKRRLFRAFQLSGKMGALLGGHGRRQRHSRASEAPRS
jgi:4-hydroxy-3-polyprenylbenzoate decarboxylase